MENMVNITYVCKFQSEIVAYFTLSSDSIKLNPEDKNHFEKRGIRYLFFPAIKIGRLAIHKEFQNMGLGTELILRIVGCVHKLSRNVGIRFISVDAYHDSVEFYKKNFFVEFIKEKRRENENVQMYFDLEVSRLKNRLHELLDGLQTKMDDLHKLLQLF